MTTERQIVQKSLYDRDFSKWLETTADQLRAKDYANLDWENLIDEIDTMGKRERRSLKSNLVILLLHLLKWQYQADQRSGSWKGSIVEHRQRIRDELEDSPSLQSYLIEILDAAYADGRDRAAAETSLAADRFPAECLYTIGQVLDRDFWPD
jgi:flagellar biosynthesis regulator FlaF